jgi:4-hydroxybenzoate polyprenyltransferase
MEKHSIKISWHTIESELLRLLRVFRIQSPSGMLLLFFPGLWGYILTQKQIQAPMVALIFCVALWARSLGCFLNDWADRSLDSCVQRTRNRPLVSSPPSLAMGVWVCFFACFPLLLLCSFYSHRLCMLMIFGIFSAILYPWCKRWTFYPQYFLAASFNAILFFAPLFSRTPIHSTMVVMYAWSFLWTLFYDTVYAFQDVKDDAAHGIKSTAVLWGADKAHVILQKLLFLRYALSFLIAYSTASMLILMGIMMYGFNLWQKTDLHCPASCMRLFKKMPWEGLLISFWLIGCQ